MLIDYGKTINKFYPKEAVTMMGLCFPCFGTNTSKMILEWLEILDKHYFPFLNQVELLKEELEKARNLFFGKGEIHITALNNIYLSLEGEDEVVKRNLMMTLFRIWEWPYYSDEEMSEFNRTLDVKIENQEISLWKYNKCAYKGPLKKDFLDDLDNQWENIESYWADHNIKPIDKDHLIWCIERLLAMVDGKVPFPEKLRNCIEQWQEIRQGMPRVVKDMRNSIEHGMLPTSMMTKQSGSIWNSINVLRDSFLSCNYGKITNVIGNFLYDSKTCLLPPGFTKDLYDVGLINFDMNFLSLVCGKGDGRKIRYVGQPPTIYQNYLNPLFSLVKSVMMKNTNIATFDQSSYFKTIVEISQDMFGIDFSGYSDFLSRNVIFFIMRMFWQVPEDIMYYIEKIFSLPVRVNNKLFYYLYGTLQGIMLDFSAITDCNQFMWALACIYEDFYDNAGFNGDDRFEGCERDYPETFMNTQMAVSICCNCVTNESKTESWKKDGIVSFCHITYDKYGNPVSGLSANSILKQKKFLTDVNSIFQVFKKTGYWEHFDSVFWDNTIDAITGLDFIVGNMADQYNKLHKTKLDRDGIKNRILLAKSVPLDYGGLNTSDITDDLSLYLNILKIQLLKMTVNNDDKPINYGFLLEEDPNGTPYIDTPYGQYLMKPKSSLNEILETLKLVDMALKEGYDCNCINLNQLKEIKRRFTAIMRNIEYDGNENKSVSTKNRVSVVMDSDRAFDSFTEARNMAIQDNQGFNLSASNLTELCFLDTLANMSNRAEGFKYYIRYQQLKGEFGKYIVQYRGFANQYYKGFKSPSTGKVVRLESNTDTTWSGRETDFISFRDLKDPIEKEFIICYQTLWGLSDHSREKFQPFKEVLISRVKSYLMSQYTSVKEYVSQINLDARDFFSVSQAVRFSDSQSVEDFFRQ